MEEDSTVDKVIKKIKLRAESARKFANISVVVIVTVVLVMIAFFYITPTTLAISDSPGSTIEIKLSWLSEVAPTLAKITAIFLAIYLIQILVGFTRYQFKVADHLDAAAFALELSTEDVEEFNKGL